MPNRRLADALTRKAARQLLSTGFVDLTLCVQIDEAGLVLDRVLADARALANEAERAGEPQLDLPLN